MEPKPKYASGYQPESVLRVRRTLLFLASKLGDLMEEIIVVGGLVPYLLVDQADLPGTRRHVGTMDLDLGLSLAILDGERYREVSDRLRTNGFRPVEKEEGKIRGQTWVSGEGGEQVMVDFLIPPNKQGADTGKITQIEKDFAAVTMEGLDLAFLSKRTLEITDKLPNGSTLTRNINVTGPGAFVLLKAIAYNIRGENKDTYDLFYILREVKQDEVLADFRSFSKEHPIVDRALAILRRDFIDDDAGRAQAAEFIQGTRDDDIEADVLAAVSSFLEKVQ